MNATAASAIPALLVDEQWNPTSRIHRLYASRQRPRNIGGISLATTISLATYTIRIRDRESGDFLPLDDFLGHDFLDVFEEYLSERESNVSDDEDAQRLLRSVKHNRSKRTISGTLESGEYGFEVDLYDVGSGSVSYKRKSTDAELLPFYMLLSVPNGSDRGVLVLEKFRQYGIRSALWADFNLFFEPYLSDVSLQLNPLVPAGLVEEIRQGKHVKSIRFIHFGLPSDVASALGPQSPINEEDGILEYVIKPKRGGKFPFLSEVAAAIRGESDLSQLVELTGFDFDQVKVQLDMDGRTRTIDIADPSVIRAQYDITDEVDLQASGHPSFSSINAAAKDVLGELHEQLGLP